MKYLELLLMLVGYVMVTIAVVILVGVWGLLASGLVLIALAFFADLEGV